MVSPPALFTSQSLNGGALTPTPHAFPNVASDPQYVPLFSLPREQQGFNFAALTPAVPAVDREYLYGSLDRKICDQYLEVFADFKYVRTFWDSALAQLQFAPDVWTDADAPLRVHSADWHQRTDSEPIQSIHRGGLHLAWRI